MSKLRLLRDKLVILSSIGLKFGLSITLDSNDGQNKFEVCISEITAKKGLKMTAWPLFAKLAMTVARPSYILFEYLDVRDESNGEKI